MKGVWETVKAHPIALSLAAVAVIGGTFVAVSAVQASTSPSSAIHTKVQQTLPKSVVKGSPETQLDMANSMWQAFNSTKLDVHTHATMEQSGVSPTQSPVTAGQVAEWLNDWATASKGYSFGFGGNGKIYVPDNTWTPWSLKYETSTEPFTWASENDLYQGTSVTGENSVLSTAEAAQVISNLKWWLNGYKMVGKTVHLHAPMTGNASNYTAFVNAEGLSVNDYESSLTEATKYLDKVTGTVTNGTLNLTLPSLKGTKSGLAWEVVARGLGNYGWNGASTVPQAQVGTTLHIKLGSSVPVVSVCILATKEKLNGYMEGYVDHDGTMSWTPIDASNGQSLN